MDPLAVAVRVLHGVCAVLAVLVARRRREHLPVAAFVVWTFVLDFARWGLNAGPLDAPRPYSGVLRALFHLDQAILLTEPFALAALGWTAFLHRRPAWPILGYLVTLAVVVLAYPGLRQAPLGYTYAGVYLAAGLATLACAAIWTRRKAHPRPEHAATSLLALLDLALFAGPFAPPAPQPFDRWSLAHVVYIVTWSALALLHGGVLWGGWFLVPSPRSLSSRLH